VHFIGDVLSMHCRIEQPLPAGSVLMMTGSLLRSGLPFMFKINYTALQIGTIFVGTAQVTIDTMRPHAGSRGARL
jgi:hypothetical protein